MPIKFKSASAFEKMRARQREELANEYAQTGRASEIGSKSFDSAVETNLAAAPMPSATQSFMNTLTSEKGIENLGYSAAYASVAVAAGYTAQQRLNQGQYVAPETMQAATLQTVLPGAGMVLGTALGAAGGIPGMMFGQYMGGAGGQMLSAGLGAGLERDKTVRETSEQLASTTGATDALKKFTDQLSQSTAPIKELQTAIMTITRAAGGTGDGTVAGLSFMQNALAERFNPALQGFVGAVSTDPILKGMLPSLNAVGYRADPSQYGGAAAALAAKGDYAGAQDAITLETGVLSTQYDRDKKFVDSWDPRTNDNALMKALYPSKTRAANAALDRLGREKPDPNAPGVLKDSVDDMNALYGTLTDIGGQSAGLASGFTSDSVGIQQAGANGATNADLKRMVKGALSRSNDLVINGDLKANAIDAYVSAHPTMGGEAYSSLMDSKNHFILESQQYKLTETVMNRDIFEREQATEAGQFGLNMLTGTFAGKSAMSLRGSVQNREGVLLKTANDPDAMLSDAERIAYRTQAKQLDIQNHQAIYAQQEGEIDVRSGKALRSVALAQSYGTPDAERKAQGEYRQTLEAQEKQLNRELAEGNLSYDQRLAKMREISQLQVQVTQNEVQSRRTFFAEKDSIYGSEFSGLTAGMDRQIRRGGNSAANVSGGTGALDREIANAKANLQSESDPVKQAQIGAQIADLTERKNAFTEQTNRYSPNAKLQQDAIKTAGDLDVSMLMPYMDGPESNRFAIGNRRLSIINRETSGLNANRTNKQKAGLWHDEDETTYQEQLQDFRRQKAQVEYSERFEMFNAVPEMVAGAPQGGVGVSMMPMSAVAAAFSPNPTVGQWGRRGVGHFDPSSLVTGKYGSGSPLHGTEAALEGGPSGAFSVSGGATTAVDLLKQIADAAQKQAQEMAAQTQLMRGRQESRPVQDHAAVVQHALGNAFDAFNPRAGM